MKILVLISLLMSGSLYASDLKLQPHCGQDFIPDTISNQVYKADEWKNSKTRAPFEATGYCEASL